MRKRYEGEGRERDARRGNLGWELMCENIHSYRKKDSIFRALKCGWIDLYASKLRLDCWIGQAWGLEFREIQMYELLLG